MPNVEKDDAHFDNRCKNLENPSVQQIQDARFMPASLLNHISRVKSVSGYQNVELRRLAFLRLYLLDATFSNVRSVPLLRDTRPVSLRRNAGLIKSVFPKCR